MVHSQIELSGTNKKEYKTVMNAEEMKLMKHQLPGMMKKLTPKDNEEEVKYKNLCPQWFE